MLAISLIHYFEIMYLSDHIYINTRHIEYDTVLLIIFNTFIY